MVPRPVCVKEAWRSVLDCLEFWRLCQIEPSNASPEFLAHARACRACASRLRRAKRLDALIGAALRVDVPDAEASQHIALTRRRRPRRWAAVAAGVLVACGIGAGLWLAAPERPALAMEVADHVRGEPAALLAGSPEIDLGRIRAILASYGIRLDEGIGAITYFRMCPFHGASVPHLVIRGPEGLVTVLFLIDKQTGKTAGFELGDFAGEIVPAGSGSIAIVGYDRPPTRAEERRIVGAVHWEA